MILIHLRRSRDSEMAKSYNKFTRMVTLHKALRQCDVAAVQNCLTPSNCRSLCGELEPLDTLCKSEYIDQRPADFLECTRLLIAAGATANTSCAALQMCLSGVDSETFAEFLRITKADPNHIGSILTGYNSPLAPLLLALILRCADGVRSLLRAGANPSVGEFGGGNQVSYLISAALPLHEAVVWGQWDVVQDILAYGADPFQKDPIRGLTALDWARHAAHSRDASSTNSAKILEFFQHLDHARRLHRLTSPILHKQLIEYVFHPTRLHKRGYFDM